MSAILYSFRRCPYAIRSRLAIASSGARVILREVSLASKPEEMCRISVKATVPVLQLADGTVIAESLEIMSYMLNRHDPLQWLAGADENTLEQQTQLLLQTNDGEFKYWLDRYKYPTRYQALVSGQARTKAAIFLQQLEDNLSKSAWLLSSRQTLADAAIFPFIRQCAGVEPEWFTSTYPRVQNWLNIQQNATLFAAVMIKQPVWQSTQPEHYFP